MGIIFGRSMFAALGLLVFIGIQRQSLALRNGRDTGAIILVGVILAIHWVMMFHAIQISTVAVAMIALHTHPIITILLEPWLFKERFQPTDLILGVIVLIGVIVLVPTLEVSNNITQGVFWGVVSALFYSIRNMFNRKYVRAYPSSVVMWYQLIVTAVVLAPYFVLFEADWVGLFSVNLLVFGIIITAIGHTLFINSLTHLKTKTISVISVIQVFYSIIYAILLLGEIPTTRTLIGGVIILGAVYYETVRGT